jgi:hypothetical protein
MDDDVDADLELTLPPWKGLKVAKGGGLHAAQIDRTWLASAVPWPVSDPL